MLFCSNSAHYSEIQLVCDGRTDGWMDGRTDGRTNGWTDGWTLGRTDGWSNKESRSTRLKRFFRDQLVPLA